MRKPKLPTVDQIATRFISLNRSFDLWIEQLSKLGIDIECPLLQEYENAILEMYGVPGKEIPEWYPVYSDMVLDENDIPGFIRELKSTY